MLQNSNIESLQETRDRDLTTEDMEGEMKELSTST